jgi:hypothetical protein
MYDGPDRRECKHCVEHPFLCEKINRVHDAIYGNEKPDEGLLWIAKENRVMIQGNTDFINCVKKHFWKLVGVCILGALSAFGSVVLKLASWFWHNIPR